MKRMTLLIALGALASAALAHAQSHAIVTAEADAGLRTLLSEILVRNPEIAAAEARTRALRLHAPQVKAMPDPMVGATAYLLRPETRVGPQIAGFSVSQRFPGFSKLDLREQAAVLEAEAAEADVEARRLKMLTRARTLYFEIAFVDAALERVSSDHGTLAHFEELARARYASGKGIQQDVVKLQAEITGVEARLLDLAAQRAALVASINALRDRPGMPVRPERIERGGGGLNAADTQSARGNGRSLASLRMTGSGERSPSAADGADPSRTATEGGESPLSPAESDFDWASLRARALESRPEVRAARLRLARAGTGVELAGRESTPEFSVGLGYTIVGRRDDLPDLEDNGKDILGISATVAVPIWRERLRAGVDEAVQRKLAAEAELRAASSEIERELAELQGTIPEIQRRVRLFENTLLAQSEHSLTTAEAAYAAGTVDALALLDSRRVVLDVHIAMDRARADLAISLARLEGAVAWPLSTGDRS